MTRTALYRHYDADGRLLYVGITDCLSERDKQHAATAHWHDEVKRTVTEWCVSRDHALALEAVAIQYERPEHNLMGVAKPAKKPSVDQRGSGKVPSPVSDYLSQNGETLSAFARRVGLSRSYVSEIAGGSRTPSLFAAVQIERGTSGSVLASDLLLSADSSATTREGAA